MDQYNTSTYDDGDWPVVYEDMVPTQGKTEWDKVLDPYASFDFHRALHRDNYCQCGKLPNGKSFEYTKPNIGARLRSI